MSKFLIEYILHVRVTRKPDGAPVTAYRHVAITAGGDCCGESLELTDFFGFSDAWSPDPTPRLGLKCLNDDAAHREYCCVHHCPCCGAPVEYREARRVLHVLVPETTTVTTVRERTKELTPGQPITEELLSP